MGLKLKLIYVLLTFLSISLCRGQDQALPNDCSNAITVCSSGILSSNTKGIGIQEVDFTNSCDGWETNSLWLRIVIAASGTLGFILTPESNAIEEDYDFFVYGPNVSCGNLGHAIRCSTTNPLQAQLPNNLTGMNGTEVDVSEGRGPDGNSFVRWLDVKVGEIYYIVIDRPIGTSAFDLQWTGSAITNGSAFPAPPDINMIEDQQACNPDGTYTFDLSSFKDLIRTNPADLVTFYPSETDASDNTNSFPDTMTLSSETKTIFTRVTNANGCYSIDEFNISSYPLTAVPDVKLVQCDVDTDNSTDGITYFNLEQAMDAITGGNEDMTVTFHRTMADRETGKLLDPNFFRGSDNQKIYLRVTNAYGCYKDIEMSLSVIPTTTGLPDPPPVYLCNINGPGLAPQAIIDLDAIRKNSDPDLDVQFYTSLYNAVLELNPVSDNIYISGSTFIYERIEYNNECQGIEKIELIVDPTPHISLENEFLICLNDPVLHLSSEQAFSTYNWIKLGNNGNELSISNEQDVTIISPGKYRLDVSYEYNDPARSCQASKEFTVLPSNIATVLNTRITDISDNNIVTVLAEGEGDYEFSIDNGPYQDSNIFENVPMGFSMIHVRDRNGCGTVDKMISVIGYDRFFTPNNDGFNDYWNIRGINAQFQSGSLVFIYDRYGKLLKQLDPLGTGWDGTYKGHLMPESDYWFRVDLEDGRTFNGHFTLKR